ncbi:hypothetical protein OROMI_009340 [Orobanche minor]
MTRAAYMALGSLGVALSASATSSSQLDLKKEQALQRIDRLNREVHSPMDGFVKEASGVTLLLHFSCVFFLSFGSSSFTSISGEVLSICIILGVILKHFKQGTHIGYQFQYSPAISCEIEGNCSCGSDFLWKLTWGNNDRDWGHHDNIWEIYGFQCWGHIIEAVILKSMGEESRMNPPDDKSCIYGLGSLGVALSAPATSSSQLSRSQPPPS